MNAHKFMLPFFVAGFYYAKKEMSFLRNKWVGIIAFVAWVLLMGLYSKDAYIYTTGVSLIGKALISMQIGIDLYRYLVAFLGVITIIALLGAVYRYMTRFENMRILTTIEYMGENSIVFYILSTYLFIWFMPAMTSEYHLNYLLTVAETIVVAVVCAGLSFLIRKNKIISKCVIGK